MPRYCVFGEAVDIASAMEASGERKLLSIHLLPLLVLITAVYENESMESMDENLRWQKCKRRLCNF